MIICPDYIHKRLVIDQEYYEVSLKDFLLIFPIIHCLDHVSVGN
jgi:hypothetical protein